jgi:putative chitinase
VEAYSIVTESTLRVVMPAARAQDISDFVGPLNAAMHEYGITTPQRQAAFLGQIAVESDQFWHQRDHYGTHRGEEYASGVKYENRHDLGNVHPGDGPRYKGHGLIQTTGFDNHHKASVVLNHDFVGHPEDLCLPEWASRSAGYYWKSHGCNELADAGTDESFIAITKKINGGTNGLKERQQFWAAAKTALAI